MASICHDLCYSTPGVVLLPKFNSQYILLEKPTAQDQYNYNSKIQTI